MTREEFLKQRAIADHLKKHGAQKLAPGNALGSIPLNVRRNHFHKHQALTHRKAAQASLEPKIEPESNEPNIRTSAHQWLD